MKIELAKKDLDGALRVVSIKEDHTDELSGYLVFRYRQEEEQVEVLAYNARVGVSTRLSGCQVTPGGVDSFTVEAHRFRKWAGAFADGVFSLSPLNGELRATVAGPVRGAASFRSVDPTQFPYWDETLAAADAGIPVRASLLHLGFSHVKLFISDKDTTSPKLAVTEIIEGALQATDKGALAVVTIDELNSSNLRIHGKDLPQVLTFLAACGDDVVDVREHDRGVFFVRGDHEVLFVGRPQHSFPDIALDTKPDDPYWWVVSKQHLRSAVASVCATAVADDTRVNFRLAGHQVLVSMAGVGEERTQAEIETIDIGAPAKDSVPMPQDGFEVSYEYLNKMLGQHRGDTVRFGLNPQGDPKTRKVRGGWIRFQEERDGADFLTLLVWLP